MNKVELQGKLARDCHVMETKKGGKMCFMTVKATRDGGSDFLPVKAFNVSETMIAALKDGADIHVIGRLQAGKYDKEKKEQLYDNTVIAEEIKCCGVSFVASDFNAPVPPVPPATAADAAA